LILPTKHISPERSLLGVGAVILRNMSGEQTATRLWERVRSSPEVGTYERFILALDLLYTINAITFKDGLVRRHQ
jgi:ABC-3C biological conflict system middle component